MYEQIWEGILLEFSDLPDAKGITRMIVRSFIAAFLGGLIGYERERSGKAAGVRTHMLVCFGTMFFVAIPEFSQFSHKSLSRIIQGITAGLGFLGAGTILKKSDEQKIYGLTTAASLWLTAAIGVAIGLGKEGSAFLGAMIALFILVIIPHPRRDVHDSR